LGEGCHASHQPSDASTPNWSRIIFMIQPCSKKIRLFQFELNFNKRIQVRSRSNPSSWYRRLFLLTSPFSHSAILLQLTLLCGLILSVKQNRTIQNHKNINYIQSIQTDSHIIGTIETQLISMLHSLVRCHDNLGFPQPTVNLKEKQNK